MRFPEKSRDYNLGYEVGFARKPYTTDRASAVKWWEYNDGYRAGWLDANQLERNQTNDKNT